MKLPELPLFNHKPKKYDGPSAEEVLRLRKEFLNPGIFLYYKKPFMMVEGKMQYVWDEHGRRYLDALGGIVTVSVGHCHPDVVDVVRNENETLQHSTTIYLQPNIAEYAKNYTNVTNELADRLASKALELEARRQELKGQVYQKVKKATSPLTAARFLQVEHQLQLLIDLQVAASLPVAPTTKEVKR